MVFKLATDAEKHWRRLRGYKLITQVIEGVPFIWRLTSFGTHSPDGSRFVERMLTVRDTLRRQERHVLDYLTTACYAALYHQPAPSLLPQDTAVSR